MREPVFDSDDPQVRRMIAAAWQRGTVEFGYCGGSAPGSVHRVIPDAVFSLSGSTKIYVESDCHLCSECLVFRLNRVGWVAASRKVESMKGSAVLDYRRGLFHEKPLGYTHPMPEEAQSTPRSQSICLTAFPLHCLHRHLSPDVKRARHRLRPQPDL